MKEVPKELRNIIDLSFIFFTIPQTSESFMGGHNIGALLLDYEGNVDRRIYSEFANVKETCRPETKHIFYFTKEKISYKQFRIAAEYIGVYRKYSVFTGFSIPLQLITEDLFPPVGLHVYVPLNFLIGGIPTVLDIYQNTEKRKCITLLEMLPHKILAPHTAFIGEA